MTFRIPPRIPPRPRHQRRRPAVRPEPAEPRLRQSASAQAAAGRHVQPQRRRARRPSGPTRKAPTSRSRKACTPLEPFQDRTLILHGVCDKVRGDGDNHMRGIGCLLTGIELFPGNIQGGSRHARRLGQRHLDRPGDQELPAGKDPATRTRFGSLEFGVHGARPGRHLDPHGLRRRRTSRSRRSTIPYQMFAKLYGRMKDQREPAERPRRRCRTT